MLAMTPASAVDDCCGVLSPFLDAAEKALSQLDTLLECSDANDGCSSWAKMGECAKNPGFMRSTCRQSCGACALGPEDRIGASEIALLATRNLALACTYAWPSSPGSTKADLCKDVHSEVSSLRQPSGANEAKLRELATRRRAQLVAACGPPPSAPSKACPLGEVPASALPAQIAEPGDVVRPSATSAGPMGSALSLIGGAQMPALGLGTWLTTGAECTTMVSRALKAGFRAIDTSENYANHDAIGEALAQSTVPRSELFLADKISFPQSYSASGVRLAVKKSLAALRTDYLDLLMLHSVGPSRAARLEAWSEMVKLQKEGIVHAIGTSNFGTREMEELRRDAPEHPPATHQTKFNPYHSGRVGNSNGEDFSADCAGGASGCHIVAYCPLNAWPSKLAPIHDGHVAAIARRVGRTPAQVLLRWVLQRGAAALTRSSSEAHLQEAMEVFRFALSEADMATISGLGWLVESAHHKPPPSVPDVFGVMTPLPVHLLASIADDGERVEL